MKDSGIKWIGNIPDTWDVIKIKYNCSLKGRIGWQGLTTDEYIDEGPFLITGTDFNVNKGKINWDSCAHVSEWRYDQAPEIQVRNGDLLITKDGTVGKVAIVSDMRDKTTLNSGVMVIRPTEDSYNTRFLYYVLKSEEFWKWFNYINSGNTTISHLYQHDLNHFHFAVTTKDEQEDITDFLDRKCEYADIIINKVKEQIEILEKAKKSLITECITKGIKKNVEMKDSKVAWIGEIPKDWTIKKIKYLSKVHSSRRIFEEEYTESGVPFFRTKEIVELSKNQDISLELFISNERYGVFGERVPKKDDIFISSIGTIGAVWVSDGRKFYYKDGNITQIDASEEFISDFVKYVLVSNIFQEAIKYYENTTTLSALTIEKIENIQIPFMKKEEQREIVKYLDKKCAVIDGIIEKKKEELDILEEQKRSLINEYITGKKRVKGYA